MLDKEAYIEYIHEVLGEGNTKLIKSLGQNYIVNEEDIKKFIVNLDPLVDVLEIGPGIGNLTVEYFKNYKKIILVEYDRNKIPILKKRLAKLNGGIFPEWISIIQNDITKVDISLLFNSTYQIIGALPYNLSKVILRQTLTLPVPPKQMLYILQKEVANKYLPTINNGFLSTYASLFADIKGLNIIPKISFYPIPKVDSKGILIQNFNYSNITELDYLKQLTSFIKLSYRFPRKKLRNNLKLALPIDEKVLNKRPEELNIHEWKTLYSISLESSLN